MKQLAPKKKHPYYDFSKLRSYNGVFNLAVGGRGIGKTYGAKRQAVRDALNLGAQFIYLRRYKEELAAAKRTFFDDLIANDEFNDWDFRVNGVLAEASGVEFRDEKKREWLTLGYFLPLSTGQQQKSVAFPEVRTIIFDEFIIEKGTIHYIRDEPTVFMNFYNTVDRNQDKTRVFMLANSVSIMNPYMLEWEIRPPENGEFVRSHKLNDGTYFIVCHFIKSEAFAESIRSTKFGQFIANTSYEKYAVGNVFLDNNDRLIEVKGAKSRYKFTLMTPKGTFSVWYSAHTNEYYAQARRPKEERIFVTQPEMMYDGASLLTRSDKLLQYLRAAFNKGSLSFDSPQTRNSLIEIFK